MILKYGGSLDVVRNWLRSQFPNLTKYDLCDRIPELVSPYDDAPKVVYRIHEPMIHVLGFWWHKEMEMRAYPPPPPLLTCKLHVKAGAFFAIPWSRSPSFLDRSFKLCDRLNTTDPTRPSFAAAFIISHYDSQLISKSALRSVFLQRMSEALSHHDDEAVKQWLSNEGCCIPTVQPTIEDLLRFPNEPVEPKLWYQCHLFHVPCDVADQLQLYEGGLVHVPKRLMGHVIWLQMERDLPAKPRQHHPIVVHYMNLLRHEQQKEQQEEMGDVEVQDMPPCIQRIIASKEYPKDADRTALLRTLQKAGKSLTYIKDIFKQKNGYTDTRWDIETQYKYGYAAPRCEAVNCPLRGDKQACRTLYLSKYGEVMDKDELLYGPLIWFKWHRTRKRHIKMKYT